jgi:hypothetical protein
MFRQAGMSKQPMGILASSPELMTTAQKAIMNNQPIKAQSAVSVNLAQAIANSTGLNSKPVFNLSDIMNNFSYGSGGPEKTYETKLIPEGAPPAGFIETTKKIKPQEKSDLQKITDNLNKSKKNIKETGNLKINDNDSELVKDSKKIGNFLFGPEGTVSKSLNSIYQTVDDNVFNYVRSKPDILANLQEEMNQKTKVDPKRNRMISGGDVTQDMGDKLSGPSSTTAPTKDGSPRGLVDPNVLSSDDPRFPEAQPKPRPPELPGVIALKNLNDLSKNKNGPTTKDSDKALGIADLSFKDRVKARRDIISAALGRDVAEKDVRTDVNYNLIMTGLLVAAGESPNAMTNIAKGLAAGLAGYGKAAGESAEAKRKEEIAIGLAAVEQEFKSDEAQKARDEMPDSIRALEIYKKRPDLLEIALQLKKKGKTRQEIATAIAAKAAGSSSMIPLTNEEMNRYVDFAMSGGAPSSSNTVVSIPNSIRIDFNGEDSSGRVGDIVPYRGQSYEIGKNGIATLVTKK